MGWGSSLSSKVGKATRLTLNQMGREWVALHRWNLNVPYPPASEPGDSPHRRTKTLQKSIKYKVKAGAKTTADLKVYIDPEKFEENGGYDYSMDLEYGRPITNLEPRPFWRKINAMIRPNLKAWFERIYPEKAAQVGIGDAADDVDSSDAADNFSDN